MAGHKGDEPLPKVEYSVVDESALVPAGVHDRVLESFGFNSGQEWSQQTSDAATATATDGRLLRWIPLMEADLARQVEYDLDEQDQLWLDAVNKKRKKEGLPPATPEVFEIVFDKLEKEWFDLQKRIPKKEKVVPLEDSKCAICEDGECENSNAIVFCDGCNLAVHQDCYGVPYIPEGQWLCRKCTVSPDKPVSCVLCPNSYGAFKQTTNSYWAHLICAIWVPETGVSNTVYMEPVDGIENISKNRWKLLCYICKKRVGACIQCANRTCFTAFHVTCARERGLELRMKNGNELTELKAYCEKHAENWTPQLAQKSAQRYTAQKAARAYKKSYTHGPPVVPAVLFERLVDYTSKIKMPKRAQFVAQVCRYWSLKREARRGAPLLKRLHLEPWTASASEAQQTDSERAKKLELIRLLRNDLEKVRMLTERVRKREKKKLERAIIQRDIVDQFIFSRDFAMSDVLERIVALDKHKIFGKPVSRVQVPDYYDIIKHPMDWATMREKLDRHEYITAQDFADDFELVINNARRYNRTDSFVHKAAVKLRDHAEPILADLETLDAATAQKHASDVASLLTLDVVEELFDYAFDAPPPAAEPVVPATKKRKLSLVNGNSSATPTVKKRTRSSGLGPEEVGPLVEPTSQSKNRSSSSAPRASSSRAPVASTSKKAIEADTIPEEDGSAVLAVQNAAEGEPVTVEDVDSRSSFKLFETGWVLPEGSSRRKGGASTSTPASVSRSKGKGRESVDSPTPTMSPIAQSVREEGTPTAKTTSLSTSSVARNLLKSILKGKRKAVVPEPSNDTPAATRARTDEESTIADQSMAESEPGSTPASAHQKSATEQRKDWENELAALHAKVAVRAKDKLEAGTLVWAKAQGFHPFPAEVLDTDDLPGATLSHKPPNADKDRLVPVLFFDGTRSSSWCSRDNLRLFGVNERVDELLHSKMTVKSLSRKNTSSKVVARQWRDLQDAYERARAASQARTQTKANGKTASKGSGDDDVMEE